MNKEFSIKDARIKKGLSIQELSQRLKLSPSIIKKIENNEELPDKFKSYEKFFRNTILKSLDLYDISETVKIKRLPEDNTKLILTIFSFFFISTILLSLSFDIYRKFNSNISLIFFEKDQTFFEIENILSNFKYEEIDHEEFINKMILLHNKNFDNFFQISASKNNSIYYRVTDNEQKTLNFGIINSDNPLILNFNDDFSIDLSNIILIDKIIINDSTYQIDVNKPYVLKNFKLNNFLNLK